MADTNTPPRPDPDSTAATADNAPGGTPFDAGPQPDREHLVQEGIEHLQRAARETIAAMRTLLDLAEEFVEDPRAAETMVNSIGSFAEAAVRSVGDMSRSHRAASAATTPGDDEDGHGVQRIPVS